MVTVNTYDGREELRSRAAGGHEGRTCYVLAEIETLGEKRRREKNRNKAINITNRKSKPIPDTNRKISVRA